MRFFLLDFVYCALSVRIPSLRSFAFFVLLIILPTQSPAPAKVEDVVIFDADFSRWEGVPLIKTKFGVYQTPFLSRENQLRAVERMREAGVQDVRYEFAWGKPDAFPFDQISGDALNPTIDFSALDPFVEKLRDAAITPLFALTYNPVPLKNGTNWQRWKDTPRDLTIYRDIIRRYAAHYRDALKIPGALYEVWNEPDIPGDAGARVFSPCAMQNRFLGFALILAWTKGTARASFSTTGRSTKRERRFSRGVKAARRLMLSLSAKK